jgi:Mannosylglycerate hydrolase MGH1-like glycoside hydrolase domain
MKIARIIKRWSPALVSFLTLNLSLATPISVSSAASMQDRVLVGAYDPSHINGLVFITGNQSFFGLRILVHRSGADFEETPRQVQLGPHAPNGLYAKVSWNSPSDSQNQITFEWSRLAQNVLIGRLSALSNVRVAIEAYRPWSEATNDLNRTNFLTQTDRRTILGEYLQNRPAPLSGQVAEALEVSVGPSRFFMLTDQVADGAATYRDTTMRQKLTKEAQQTPQSETSGVNQHAALSFELNPGRSVGFVALVGNNFEEMEREAGKLVQRQIAQLLEQSEKSYDSTRPSSSGGIGDSLETINRAISWNRIYYPEKQLEYIASNRQVGTILNRDSFITAMIGSMIDTGSSAGTIRAILEGQMPDGRVPLRRFLENPPRGEIAILSGRSMPPIGAFCVWKHYLLTNDLGLLAWAYPRLLQWNDWWLSKRADGQSWRDGNGDGLLEWGYDAQIEQGLLGARGLPNSTKLMLALSESGIDETKEPARQNDQVKFNDRTQTIEFSPIGLNALYALDTENLLMIARELGMQADVVRLQTRLERIKDLVNTKLWSEVDSLYLNRSWDGRFLRQVTVENFYPLLAGLASEERAKRMLTTLRETKKYLRDDAVMNYFLYLGLRRYGFHDEAAELALRNRTTSHGPSPGLMLWAGIEEIICAEPWAGMSLGSASVAEESRIEGINIFGATFDVISGPKRTILKRGGNLEIECEEPVRLRAYRGGDYALSFAIDTKERVRIQVPAIEGRKITVSVDDKVLGSTSPGASASFRVPAGTHKVLIVK